MGKQKQKSGFVVKTGYIVLLLIIFAIALAVTFEVGVYVGKERLINGEMEAMRQIETQTPIVTKTVAKDTTTTNSNSDISKISDNLGTPIQSDNRPSQSLPPKDLPNQSELETAKSSYTIIPQYTVQVGVFSSRQNAEKLVNMLKAYEYDSWVVSKADNEKSLYFVFNGKFETKEEAEKFGNNLKARLTYIKDFKVKKLE
jgi:cell division septation protein DedD